MSVPQSSIAKVEEHLDEIERYMEDIRRIPGEGTQQRSTQGATAVSRSAVKESEAVGSAQPRHRTHLVGLPQAKLRESAPVASDPRPQTWTKCLKVSVPVYFPLGTTAGLARGVSSESLLSSSSSSLEGSPSLPSPPPRYGAWRAVLGSVTSSSMSVRSLVSFSSIETSPAGEFSTRWIQWEEATYYLLASHYEKCNAAFLLAHTACHDNLTKVKGQEEVNAAGTGEKSMMYSTPSRSSTYHGQSLSTQSRSSYVKLGKGKNEHSVAERRVRSRYIKKTKEHETACFVGSGKQQEAKIQEVQTSNEATSRSTTTSVSTGRSADEQSAIASTAYDEERLSTTNYSSSNGSKLSGSTTTQKEEIRLSTHQKERHSMVYLRNKIEHMYTKLVDEEKRARRTLQCCALLGEEAAERAALERREDGQQRALVGAVGASAMALRARWLRQLGDSLRALQLAEEDSRAGIEEVAQYAAMSLADSMRRSGREAIARARRRVASEKEKAEAFIRDLEHSRRMLKDEERRAREWLRQQALLSHETATRAPMKYEEEAGNVSGTKLVGGDMVSTAASEARRLDVKLFSTEAEDPVPEEITVEPTPLMSRSLRSICRTSRSNDEITKHSDESVDTLTRRFHEGVIQTLSCAAEEIPFDSESAEVEKCDSFSLPSHSNRAEVLGYSKDTQSPSNAATYAKHRSNLRDTEFFGRNVFTESDSSFLRPPHPSNEGVHVKDSAEEEEEEKEVEHKRGDRFVPLSAPFPVAFLRAAHRPLSRGFRPSHQWIENSSDDGTMCTLTADAESFLLDINSSNDGVFFFPVDYTVSDLLRFERRHRQRVGRQEQLERNELRWDEMNRFRTRMSWQLRPALPCITEPFVPRADGRTEAPANVLMDSSVHSPVPLENEDKENAGPVNYLPAVSWCVSMVDGPGSIPPHLRKREWAPMLTRSRSAGWSSCENASVKSKRRPPRRSASVTPLLAAVRGGSNAEGAASADMQLQQQEQQQCAVSEEQRGSYAMQFQRFLTQQQQQGGGVPLPSHPPYCRATASFLESAEWRYQKMYISQLHSMSMGERREGTARKCADAVCDEICRISPPRSLH